MFNKAIIDSDIFLDMPLSAQALYFHYAMRADDDGFINNPNRITALINANRNDHDILIVKGFIIPFESGICVIKHWRIHNYLRNDRYKPTAYQTEKDSLQMAKNNEYLPKKTRQKGVENTVGIPNDNQMYTNGIPNDNQRSTQYRLGKDRLGKVSIGEGDIIPPTPTNSSQNFTEFPTEQESGQKFLENDTGEFLEPAPSLDQIKAYILENGLDVDPSYFFKYYESRKWRDYSGKRIAEYWQSTLLKWHKDESSRRAKQSAHSQGRMQPATGGKDSVLEAMGIEEY